MYVLSRRSLIAAAGGALCLSGAGAAETSWPSRTVTLVVPYAAGGATDIAARYLAQRLSQRLQKEVIVDNRAGAGGLIGAAHVAGSASDGHTLLFCEGSFSTNAALRPDARGSGLKDLTPVVLVGTQPYVIIANAGVPAKNLQELVAYARSQPGRLNYASGGNTTSTHFAGELFKSVTGTRIVHIPYRGGGPAIQSIAAGDAQLGFMSVPATIPHLQAGRMKALAVTGPKRAKALPNVPTTAEAGLPKMVGQNWVGVFAPVGTPADLVAKVNAEWTAVLAQAEVRAQMDVYALDPAPEGTERITVFLREDIKRWSELVKSGVITPE